MSTVELWLRATADAAALRAQLAWMEEAWLRAEADADFWYAQANNPTKAAQLRRQLTAATPTEIRETPADDAAAPSGDTTSAPDERINPMDEDYISIQNGDDFTVAKNSDGGLSIKIQNTVWVEEPRWIHVSVAGEHDRTTAINNLIHALEQLRDDPKA